MNELLIEAGRTERQYWRDLWRYRELFYFLAWRDLLVRYKQTFVGVSWSLIRPLLTMIVLTVVFGKLGKMPSGGVPYPLLVLCGMLPWHFFSTAMAESGNSLVIELQPDLQDLFPAAHHCCQQRHHQFCGFPDLRRLPRCPDDLVPLRASYGCVYFCHFLCLLAFGASLGVGLWIAALMVKYRDFRFIVPFIVQFGLYISPVGFQSSVVPERFRFLYALNPMVGVIDGFRWCLLGAQNGLYWPGFAIAVIEVIVLVVSGIWYFRKTEQTFADVI